MTNRRGNLFVARDVADVRTLPSNLCLLRFACYVSGSLLQNHACSIIRATADFELCLGQSILWYVGFASSRHLSVAGNKGDGKSKAPLSFSNQCTVHVSHNR